MPNVAIIDKIVNISDLDVQIIGVFTDQNTFKIPFNVIIHNPKSNEEVRAVLAARLDDSLKQSSVTLKEGQQLDLTPPIITVTPPDPAISQFLTDYIKLRSMVTVASLGIVVDVATQLSIVQKQLDNDPNLLQYIL